MSRVQVLDGFTAYGIAVKHGFHGTEEEWLESLRANGNVNPVAADETMTIPVGVDDAGRLYSGKDPDVDQLKSDLAVNAEADAETSRKLDYLWKLNHGISYQFESDNGESYRKTVPSGAKLASVEAIGGHTEVVGGELVSAQVECIVEHGRNLFDIRIDSETKETTLTVDIREPLYIKMYPHNISILKNVWRVRINTKLGNMYYVYDNNNKIKVIATESNPIVGITYRAMNITGGYYDVQVEKNSNEPAEFTPYHRNTYAIGNSVRELTGYGWSVGDVYNSIERTETGWQYVQRVGRRAYQEGDTVTDGVTSFYVLDKPTITDITDFMDGTLDAIPVETGGTLTFENAAKLSVPSSVEYIVSLAEVNG